MLPSSCSSELHCPWSMEWEHAQPLYGQARLVDQLYGQARLVDQLYGQVRPADQFLSIIVWSGSQVYQFLSII